MNEFVKAQHLIEEFKGESYVYGMNVLAESGRLAASLGKKVIMVRDNFPGSDRYVAEIYDALRASRVNVVEEVFGAAPNAPLEDLYRITTALKSSKADTVISFGGGSTIDAVKAAVVLDVLGGSIEDYFGTGMVTVRLKNQSKSLLPHLAIQTAPSSGAHLTKYSNITDLALGQKKLIVDEAIVPMLALFDYAVTFGAPGSLTADGALDGLSHSLEVLYSSVAKPNYARVEQVALEAIRLIVAYLPAVLRNPNDSDARMALGLATDLGGYAIMLGGTNGAHLTSFSLVDVLSHGRACGLLNPYYTVFFAPAVADALREVAEIYTKEGYLTSDPDLLSGRELGIAVAQAMIAFEERIGFPTKLEEISGYSDQYIDRALTAAKNPQLKMKLENMPIPMTAEMVDEFMRPLLLAAKSGQLELIKNVS